MNLAKNLKKYRGKRDLTQEALSRKADISYNTVIKLETQGNKDPEISTMIADVFGISIDDLVSINDKNK